MKKEQGFSLIELLIVVAIIAIIAAIAVPSMLTARMASNEASAVQSCRTFGSAQLAFAATNNQQYTTIDELVTQNFLDERFQDGSNGYTYAEAAVGYGVGDLAPPDGFQFLASPQTDNVTGRYVYGIVTDQVVRYVSTVGGATPPAGLTEGDPIGKLGTGGGS